MVDQSALDSLAVLIDCLRTTPPSDERLAAQKREAFSRKVINQMFEKQQSWGEAAGGALGFLAKPDALERIKSIKDNLGDQVEIVSNSFAEYLQSGVVPASYYAWRIAVILRKGKLLTIELEFLRAWCLHFGEVKGTRYEMITKRLHKIEADSRRS